MEPHHEIVPCPLSSLSWYVDCTTFLASLKAGIPVDLPLKQEICDSLCEHFRGCFHGHVLLAGQHRYPAVAQHAGQKPNGRPHVIRAVTAHEQKGGKGLLAKRLASKRYPSSGDKLPGQGMGRSHPVGPCGQGGRWPDLLLRHPHHFPHERHQRPSCSPAARPGLRPAEKCRVEGRGSSRLSGRLVERRPGRYPGEERGFEGAHASVDGRGMDSSRRSHPPLPPRPSNSRTIA